MTFSSPWWLLLLLAPVAVAAAYLLVQRRRMRSVVRFTSVDLLSSVAPRRTGWQRHVSAVGMLAALVALGLAIAGPTVTKRVATERATIVLALDTSASILADDIAPSRLAAAQDRARNFVDGLPEGLQVGLVSFDTQARALVTPTTDYGRVVEGIDALQVGSGTATAAGITQALQEIASQPAGESGGPGPAAIVLMSDGSPTIGLDGQDAEQSALDAASSAKSADVPIYTIAFGTSEGVVTVQGQTVPVPYDPEAMAQIAQTSGGRAFTAESSDELATVYDQIGRDVAFRDEPYDLTTTFTGVGLALALLTCCAALYWNQRVV
jgi:Ca-activated chloride channel family protein